MATVTYVFSIDYVAKLLDEDLEFLQAIVSNADNLSYGCIISVYTGPDEAITSLTSDGMEELEQMLAHARRTTDEWSSYQSEISAVTTETTERLRSKRDRSQSAR
jgi:hypothetical protein